MEGQTECKRCLLNTSDTSHIFFNSNGICNYCEYYDFKIQELGSLKQRTDYLDKKIIQVKQLGINQKYDCLLGLSGGVDSSYVAVMAHEMGLRPLVVHLDNGWNSDTAVQNIEKICEKFQFELYTYVIDWEEFVGLQKAYLKAGVIDIEVLTDHAIYSVLKKLAHQHHIKYILSGFNYATEAIMPKGWTHNKRDFLNIKDIVQKHSEGDKFKTYPYINFYKALYYHWFLKIETIEILNYIDYDKDKTKDLLNAKVDWKDYGGKHYESVFTKFYQSYILPQKFGVDKRRAHLSNQICSGKINKSEANKILNEPLINPIEFENEKAYILKKFNLTNDEFELIMNEKPHSHFEYKSDQILWNRYFKIIRLIKKLTGKK